MYSLSLSVYRHPGYANRRGGPSDYFLCFLTAGTRLKCLLPAWSIRPIHPPDIGGGTVRDLLLGTDHVFWISDTRYLWACIGASVATWFLARLFAKLNTVLLWADALGLALFSVLGTIKALNWDAPYIVAIGMGMMTASFGSLIRDTLLGRPPVLLEPNIYVTAALLGAASYTLILSLPVLSSFALPLSVAAAFLLRASAIVFDLRLPKYRGHN